VATTETRIVSIPSVTLAVYLSQNAVMVSAATFAFMDNTAHILQPTGVNRHSNNMPCWLRPQHLDPCLAQVAVLTVAQMAHAPIGSLSHIFQAVAA